jgi:hypothetical protein
MAQEFLGLFDLQALAAWWSGKTDHGLPVAASRVFGFVEVVSSIAAAYATRMIPLRFGAMLSNVAGLIYGFLTGSLSSIVEHGVNLPLNLARAREMQKLIVAVRDASNTDLNIEWLKPFAHSRKLKAGEVIFSKGETASEAYILVEGEVEIPEVGVKLAPGDIFGEMALFTLEGTRLASAVCNSEVLLLYITYEEFEQHYFQNPEFGLYLVRLIVRRFDMNYRRALALREGDAAA